MNLTVLQKRIIIAGLCALGLMTLVVPWTFSGGVPAGYSLIFWAPYQTPRKTEYDPWPSAVHIDLVRLVVPMAVVCVATCAAVALTKPTT